MYASTLSARPASPARSNARARLQHISSVGACPAASASMKTPSADAVMSSRSYIRSMLSNADNGRSASATALSSAYAFAASRCLSAAHDAATADASAATRGAALENLVAFLGLSAKRVVAPEKRCWHDCGVKKRAASADVPEDLAAELDAFYAPSAARLDALLAAGRATAL